MKAHYNRGRRGNQKSIKIDITSGGECLPDPEKEKCVSYHIHHPHFRLWRICMLFLGLLSLASCKTSSPAEVAMTRAAPHTAAPAAAAPAAGPASSKTSTPQTPPPALGNVIPRPASAITTGGTFTLSANTVITLAPATEELKAIGQYLAETLRPATGYNLEVLGTNAAPANGNIHLTLNGADPASGDEGYQLVITPELVKVVANQPAGLFHAVQTIRQLLPSAIDSSTIQPGPWAMGTGTITDAPRFAWRGAMLDVARHFFSVRDVSRYIDLLAYYKINTLHLHLSNDQGWRIQINSWPNLAIHGGSLEVGGTPGGYYSQDDYAYIVDYARRRYITIVPEIDMPGHFNAALSSYPELTCDGVAPELYTGTRVGFSSTCVNKDITYTFLEDVIGELAALTPGPYFHIGGDEAQSTSPADYVTFVKRVQSIVEAQGKQVVGWEEIAQAPLLPGAIVQHWNLDASYAPQAVQKGARVIMSPADKAYLDMKYEASTVLGQDWAGTINIETGYSWDPAALIEGIGEKSLLGVEAPLWSETLITMDDLEYLAFPRLPGYAEIGWTPQALRDWGEYKNRLAAHGPRLAALGVDFYASPEILWP
jgi:hexosaminidase